MSISIFQKLVDIIAALRGENGCPWDKQQTHPTLKGDLLEETYEVVEAIEAADAQKLKEELGDLMMVLLLHVQIAVDEGEFHLEEVLSSIVEKLIRRHPHVFGDVRVKDAKEALDNWEQIKDQEVSHVERESLMDGIPKPLPALMAAQKIQRRAARVGFDWDDISDVLPKLYEELDELTAAVRQGDMASIEMELGDLLFSMVNLARFLEIDAENALRRANAKFVGRFKQMERILAERGTGFEEYDLEGLDQIWEEVKRDTRA